MLQQHIFPAITTFIKWLQILQLVQECQEKDDDADVKNDLFSHLPHLFKKAPKNCIWCTRAPKTVLGVQKLTNLNSNIFTFFFLETSLPQKLLTGRALSFYTGFHNWYAHQAQNSQKCEQPVWHYQSRGFPRGMENTDFLCFSTRYSFTDQLCLQKPDLSHVLEFEFEELS